MIYYYYTAILTTSPVVKGCNFTSSSASGKKFFHGGRKTLK